MSKSGGRASASASASSTGGGVPGSALRRRVFEISPQRLRLRRRNQEADADVDGESDGDSNVDDDDNDGDDEASAVLVTGRARYRLAARIGEGSFGRTYLAWMADSDSDSAAKRPSLRRGRPVVVKAMKLPEAGTGSGGGTALEMRCRSLESMDVARSIAHVASCRHPFIAKLLDSRYALSADETPFEVYEHYPAGDALSLLDHIGASDEPHKEAVNLQAHVLYLGLQVAEAVSYLHESGYIHFDLKLDNVFIDELGDARLGDFGLAKPCRLGASLANPYCYYRASQAARFTAIRWVPPEQLAEREQPVGHAVDWYSLGALLYHLAYRRLPFEEHRVRALSMEAADGDEQRKRRFLQLWRAGPRPRVDERPRLNQKFKNLLYNLLAYEPAQRLGGGGGGCGEVFPRLHQLCSSLRLTWFDSAAPNDVDKIRRLVRSRQISRPYRVKLLELGLP